MSYFPDEWAVIKSFYMKFLMLILLFCHTNYSYGAEKLKKHIGKVEHGGLKKILKRRYLRVLTTRNAYDYYIYQGRTKGIQYEMAREFTKYLNKKFVKKGELRIVFEMIPVDFDQLIPMLTEGKGDIIAVGITRTPKRESQIDFTIPYRVVDEVIVTRKELVQESWKGKTFHVQKNSSYFHSLSKHKDLVKVEEVDPNFHAGNVMELVSLKKYDYTLVNSFWAQTIGKAFENLEILKSRLFTHSFSAIKISFL